MPRFFASLVAFLVLYASLISAADKTAPTYQKGTIAGYDTRLDTWGSNGDASKRRARVYELKGTDLVYQIDYCGAFQAGKFDAGQTVEYRVQGERLYIRRDNNEEFKCKIEGKKAVVTANSGAAPSNL